MAVRAWAEMSTIEKIEAVRSMTDREKKEFVQTLSVDDLAEFINFDRQHSNPLGYPNVPRVDLHGRRLDQQRTWDVHPRQKEEMARKQQAKIEAIRAEAEAKKAAEERQRKLIERATKFGVPLFQDGSPRGMFKYLPTVTRLLQSVKATDFEIYTFEQNLLRCVKNFRVGLAFRERAKNAFRLNWGEEKRIRPSEYEEIQVFADLKGSLIRALFHEKWLSLSPKEDEVITSLHPTRHYEEDLFIECDQGVDAQKAACFFSIGVELLKKFGLKGALFETQLKNAKLESLKGKLIAKESTTKTTEWFLKHGSKIEEVLQKVVDSGPIMEEVIAKVTEKICRGTMQSISPAANNPTSFTDANRVVEAVTGLKGKEAEPLENIVEAAYFIVGFTPLGDLDTLYQIFGQIGILFQKIIDQITCNEKMWDQVRKESIHIRIAMMQDIANLSPEKFIGLMKELGYGDSIPSENFRFYRYKDSTFLFEHDRRMLDPENFYSVYRQGSPLD